MGRDLKWHWREVTAVLLVLVGGLSIDFIGSFAGGFIAGFGAYWLLSLWTEGT